MNDKLNIDLQRIIELLQARYERKGVCAAVILADDKMINHYLGGDGAMMLKIFAEVAAQLIEKISDSPADVLHYRLELMRGVADECARLWKQNRGETIGGWKDD